jgi:uncharacterized membrane protein
MTERIKEYLNSLLKDAPKTRRVEEMRQELLAGCLDKYADLTAQGMPPEEAYNKVIEGIGDVDELLGHIEKVNVFDPAEAEKKRKKRALLTCVGIGLFFLGIVLAAIAQFEGDGEIGGILFLMCAAAGTVVLIYGRMTNAVKYERTDDTIVEDIKVKMTEGKKGANKMLSLASGSLWCLVVLVYFVTSFFLWSRWELTWVIFLIGAALQCLLTAYFIPESKGKSLTGAFWCGVVTLYFIVSFLTYRWEITWMLFLLAAAVMMAGRFFKAWKEEQ